jgi:hypothetical protein
MEEECWLSQDIPDWRIEGSLIYLWVRNGF